MIANVSGFFRFTKMKERKNAPISFDGYSSYRFLYKVSGTSDFKEGVMS